MNTKNTTTTSAPNYTASIGGTINYLTQMVVKKDAKAFKHFNSVASALTHNGILRPRKERNNGKGIHLTSNAHRAYSSLIKHEDPDVAKGAAFIIEVANQRKDYASSKAKG